MNFLHIEPGTVWKSSDKRETRHVRVFSFDPVGGRVKYHRSNADGTDPASGLARSSNADRFVKAFTLVPTRNIHAN